MSPAQQNVIQLVDRAQRELCTIDRPISEIVEYLDKAKSALQLHTPRRSELVMILQAANRRVSLAQREIGAKLVPSAAGNHDRMRTIIQVGYLCKQARDILDAEVLRMRRLHSRP
jgi:hypothetical protein